MRQRLLLFLAAFAAATFLASQAFAVDVGSVAMDSATVYLGQPFALHCQLATFPDGSSPYYATADLYRLSDGVWSWQNYLPLDTSAQTSTVSYTITPDPGTGPDLYTGAWYVVVTSHSLYYGDYVSAHTAFQVTEPPPPVSPNPRRVSVSLRADKSVVSFNSRKVRLSGQVFANGRKVKRKRVVLCRNGRGYRKLTTDKNGRFSALVSAGYYDCTWKVTYSGIPSRERVTTGATVAYFSGTGNLLEYPTLRKGHSYQVIVGGNAYRVDMAGPGGSPIYHRYGTFSFKAKRGGQWIIYAANQDIFDGQDLDVVIW